MRWVIWIIIVRERLWWGLQNQDLAARILNKRLNHDRDRGVRGQGKAEVKKKNRQWTKSIFKGWAKGKVKKPSKILHGWEENKESKGWSMRCRVHDNLVRNMGKHGEEPEITQVGDRQRQGVKTPESETSVKQINTEHEITYNNQEIERNMTRASWGARHDPISIGRWMDGKINMNNIKPR